MNMLPTLAYIDPMSGAIVLQLIIAGIAGAAAYFRRSIWACVRLLCGKAKSADAAAGDGAQTREN